MLTEICAYLKNYFDFNMPKYYGRFIVNDGIIVSDTGEDMGILSGQYFRIIGSVFNDGVYTQHDERLTNETFDGAVWLMAIPQSLVALASEIELWQNKYGGVQSPSMSPYNSESFAGYSYSKSSGAGAGATARTGATGWQSAYADRLIRWKKI